MNLTSYKYCAVPLCNSSTIKTPNKLFVHVPTNEQIRKKWLKLARTDVHRYSVDSNIYFCEDHFDMPNEMENYMQYHIMGAVRQVRMKPGVQPSKFECEEDWRKRTNGSTERPYRRKKQRMSTITKCPMEHEEKCAQRSCIQDTCSAPAPAAKPSKTSKANKRTNADKGSTADKARNGIGGNADISSNADKMSKTDKQSNADIGRNAGIGGNADIGRNAVKRRNADKGRSAGIGGNTEIGSNAEKRSKADKESNADKRRNAVKRRNADRGRNAVKGRKAAKQSNDDKGRKAGKGKNVGKCSNADKGRNADKESSLLHAIHRCNNCYRKIFGFRHACVECANYELCGACEARGHHETHYVLRVPPGKPNEEVDAVLQRIRDDIMNNSCSLKSKPEEELLPNAEGNPLDIAAPGFGSIPLEEIKIEHDDSETESCRSEDMQDDWAANDHFWATDHIKTEELTIEDHILSAPSKVTDPRNIPPNIQRVHVLKPQVVPKPNLMIANKSTLASDVLEAKSDDQNIVENYISSIPEKRIKVLSHNRPMLKGTEAKNTKTVLPKLSLGENLDSRPAEAFDSPMLTLDREHTVKTVPTAGLKETQEESHRQMLIVSRVWSKRALETIHSNEGQNVNLPVNTTPNIFSQREEKPVLTVPSKNTLSAERMRSVIGQNVKFPVTSPNLIAQTQNKSRGRFVFKLLKVKKGSEMC